MEIYYLFNFDRERESETEKRGKRFCFARKRMKILKNNRLFEKMIDYLFFCNFRILPFRPN